MFKMISNVENGRMEMECWSSDQNATLADHYMLNEFILISINQAFWLTTEDFAMCNVHEWTYGCDFDNNNLTALIFRKLLQCSVPDTRCPMDTISTIGAKQTHMHDARTDTNTPRSIS